MGFFFIFSCIYWAIYYGFDAYIKYSGAFKGVFHTTQEKVNRILGYILSYFNAIILIAAVGHMVFYSCPIPGKSLLNDERCLDHTSAGMEIFLLASLSYFVNDTINLSY